LINVLYGDMLEILPTLEENSFDSCVTDPPYHLQSIVKRFKKVEPEHTKTGQDIANRSTPIARLARGFMGKEWDGGDIAFRPDTWAEVYRVLKPGAFLVAFSSTRTYHRIACAVEDAGFEIRDQLAWVYGTGFPKSHNISKDIDKAAGAERETIRIDAKEVRNPKVPGGGRDGTEGATSPWIETALKKGFHEKTGNTPVTEDAKKWDGFGTALKPAWEPIVLARKPLEEKTVAAQVLVTGTGALNIDACRIEAGDAPEGRSRHGGGIPGNATSFELPDSVSSMPAGRWPANLAHDGSDEVLAEFAKYGESKSGKGKPHFAKGILGKGKGAMGNTFSDSGTAARFFYSAKANAKDRAGSKHPTVKPISLMEWLCTLVTQPGGSILDPFAGSGTTGIACKNLGFNCTLIEREKEYIMDIYKRFENLQNEEKEREYT